MCMDNDFDLNHRVVLQREKRDNGNDGYHDDYDDRFENITEVWANIKPITIKQNFSRMKNDAEISHIITIRYRKDAKDCKRVIFNSRVFDVLGMFCPDENYKFLVFNAKEIA